MARTNKDERKLWLLRARERLGTYVPCLGKLEADKAIWDLKARSRFSRQNRQPWARIGKRKEAVAWKREWLVEQSVFNVPDWYSAVEQEEREKDSQAYAEDYDLDWEEQQLWESDDYLLSWGIETLDWDWDYSSTLESPTSQFVVLSEATMRPSFFDSLTEAEDWVIGGHDGMILSMAKFRLLKANLSD